MPAGQLALPRGCTAQLDQNTAHISAKQTLPLLWHAVTLAPRPLRHSQCRRVLQGDGGSALGRWLLKVGERKAEVQYLGKSWKLRVSWAGFHQRLISLDGEMFYVCGVSPAAVPAWSILPAFTWQVGHSSSRCWPCVAPSLWHW